LHCDRPWLLRPPRSTAQAAVRCVRRRPLLKAFHGCAVSTAVAAAAGHHRAPGAAAAFVLWRARPPPPSSRHVALCNARGRPPHWCFGSGRHRRARKPAGAAATRVRWRRPPRGAWERAGAATPLKLCRGCRRRARDRAGAAAAQVLLAATATATHGNVRGQQPHYSVGGGHRRARQGMTAAALVFLTAAATATHSNVRRRPPNLSVVGGRRRARHGVAAATLVLLAAAATAAHGNVWGRPLLLSFGGGAAAANGNVQGRPPHKCSWRRPPPPRTATWGGGRPT